MKNIFIHIILVYTMCSNMLIAQDQMPNREQRIYSLSKIWEELNYNFAFPENLKKANIDSLYMVYLPKVEQVKNDYEYYRVLSEFMAHFNEAHTRIYVDKRPDDTPPIKTINFGKRVIVGSIAQNMIDKIPLGSEILKIDNIPVVEYIKDSVYPYIAAATPHWKFDKAVTEILYGKPLTTVNVTVKTPEGKEKEVKMIRDYLFNGSKEPMMDSNPSSPINIKIIDENIGYIHLASFAGQYLDTINNVFNKYLPQLRDCKGLIIDIRGNRGGTDQAWENIAYHLISESQFKLSGKWLSRINIATYKNWGEDNSQLKDYYLGTSMQEIKHSPYINELSDSLKFAQPLIIISGQYVGSAAEGFLLLMKEYKRGVVIGEPSVGCVGEPIFIPLSGNWEVMMCAKKYISPDGSQPNETGIIPDIKVERDYDMYMKGRDNVLEYGVKELQKRINI